MREQASDGFMVPTMGYLHYTTFPCCVFEIFDPVLSYRSLSFVILGPISSISALKRNDIIPNMEKLASTSL